MQYHPPLDDLKDLAEAEMADKRVEVGDEQEARELYDVPTEPVAELADQQGDEERS